MLRTSSNLLLLNLCISGLGLVVPNALFFINLYHRGPYTGAFGAKVCFGLSTSVKIKCKKVKKI